MNITVFTDGSFFKDKNDKGYAGYGIYFPNNEIKSVSRPFLLEPITSQRAELYAIYVAIIKIVTELEYNNITVYTDSEYSVKSLTEWIYTWANNGWKRTDNKPVKNRDILELIYKLLLRNKDKISFVHVRSHTGSKDSLSIANDIVDKLAQRGARNSKLISEQTETNFFIKSKPEKSKKIKINTTYQK